MDDLERKFKILAQTLQKTEPERADRILHLDKGRLIDDVAKA